MFWEMPTLRFTGVTLYSGIFSRGEHPSFSQRRSCLELRLFLRKHGLLCTRHTGVCIYLLHSPYCLIQVAPSYRVSIIKTMQKVPRQGNGFPAPAAAGMCRTQCTLARTCSTTVMYTKPHKMQAAFLGQIIHCTVMSPQTAVSPLLTSRATLWCLASCCPGAVIPSMCLE